MSFNPACRLLAIDLDGTLLDTKHALPAANRAALHRAHEAGIKVVLCTGRSFAETRHVLDQIGLDLDATITVSGAVLSDARSGRTLFRWPISLKTAIPVTRWFADRGYAVLWLTDRDEVAFDGYLFDGRKRHPAYERWIVQSQCQVRRSGEIACIEPAAAAALNAPLRISIIDEPAALEIVSASLSSEFGDSLAHNLLHAPPYNLTVIEAFAPQVNKWFGIQQLCRHWNIDPRQTAAIGDGVNDMAMLQNAGISFAMGNAPANVRNAAHRVVCTNDECGVAAVIDELLVKSS